MSELKNRKRMKHAIGKKGNVDESKQSDQFIINDNLVDGNSEKNQSKPLKNKKRKKSRKDVAELNQVEEAGPGVEIGHESEGHGNEVHKPRRKKGKDKKEAEVEQQNDKLVEEIVENDQGKRLKNKKRKKSGKDEAEPVAAIKLHQVEGGSGVEYGHDSEGLENEESKPRRKKGLKRKEAGASQQKAKLKKSGKMKNQIQSSEEEGNVITQIQSSKEEGNVITKKVFTEADVHQISSGDEDCSIGIKKWVMEHHQRRPGLKELQDRIDNFIAAHEDKLDQERKEKEAKAAEDGWTVVVHHKGRKKTTEAETGVTVGSVTLAAAQENEVSKKKKTKEMLDFYRFQRREARKNEIMMLQSKFEQDKKRIQEMRAARKFRPY